MRQRVAQSTGINLAALNVVPPAPPAPIAAPAGAVQAAVPAPPAPPAPAALPAPIAGTSRQVTTTTTTDDQGKTVSRILVKTRDKDGKLSEQRWDMPEISSQACAGPADAKEMVVNEIKDGRRRMIICTNRIQAAAAQGATLAANSGEIERDALRAAASGLRAARASIEGNASMTAAQRAEALKGIDQGLAEVTADMATGD